MHRSTSSGNEVAVVGLAARLPGAPTVEGFWENLLAGRESIRHFTDEELRRAGVSEATLADPAYVRASPVLEGIDQFDAAFFGVSPREARLLDPQHRLLLELAWEAFEHAGYDVARLGKLRAGVFAGASPSTYLLRNLVGRLGRGPSDDLAPIMFGNAGDFLPTRISYKLDLRGPSVNVQTACSTSLSAIHQAIQSLLAGECDLALAGGVTLQVPQVAGYHHTPESIQSADGRCRPFDASGGGTLFGSGLGLVVLKRLEDAVRDRDDVWAVVLGSTMTNDGAAKAGFSAPSMDGQRRAIEEAHWLAGVEASSIGYVEAHGTGTALGDAIELAALGQAFGDVPRQSCALGSVKSNLGHLDVAAGVAGFVKAVLALRHATIPASLHVTTPNPELARSPFHVATEARPFPKGDEPRRAGVSAFGIGGTNVHVVLEEAPAPAARPEAEGASLLVLSARTGKALAQASERLAAALERRPELALGDVAHTLQAGRRRFPHRRFVVATDLADAVASLRASSAPARSAGGSERPARVVFAFPGQGSQTACMARQLLRTDAAFRDDVKGACALVAATANVDLAAALEDGARLEDPAAVQLALLVVGVSLARWLERGGVRPAAVVGHSVGEWAGAVVAGVLSLEDAVRGVTARARAMASTGEGAMLAVATGESAARAVAGADVDVAVVNAAEAVVLSGSPAAIDEAERRFAERGVATKRLAVRTANHSRAMDTVVEPLRRALAGLALSPPAVPFLASATGAWHDAASATDPSTWAKHVRLPVRFDAALERLAEVPETLVLELGPGGVLSALARRRGLVAVPLLPARDGVELADAHLHGLGAAWAAGLDLDGLAFGGEHARRVALPTYPFERRSFWVDGVVDGVVEGVVAGAVDGGVDAAAHAAARAARADEEASDAPTDPVAASDAGRVLATVATVWSGLLGVEALTPEDDFFALGGDSMLGTQVVSRLRARLGVEVAVRDLFEAPTLGALATLLEGRASVVLAPIPRRPAGAPAPLSFAQERLCFLELLEPGNPGYVVPEALRLVGRLDLRALHDALDAIVERHEVLRTVFAPDAQGVVRAVVKDPSTVKLPVTALQGTAAEREAELAVLARREARAPFDLARGPLLRARVLAVAPDDHVLLLTLHHVVTDRWSTQVLVRELTTLYRAALEGRSDGLAPLPLQYGDFAAWQRAELEAPAFAAHLDWWRTHLADAPAALTLPTDRPRPPVQTAKGGTVRFTLPVALRRAVAELGARSGATPFMTLFAAFSALLHRLGGDEDLVVGSPIANRTRPELEGLVGFFASTLAIRTRLDPQASFATLLAATKATMLEAHAHQDVPFERLVETLAPARDRSRTPLFQVMFILQNTPVGTLELPGLSVRAMLNESEGAKFDLTLALADAPEGVVGYLEYNADLFDRETAERFGAAYRALLEHATRAPETAVAELHLLDAADRVALLRASAGAPVADAPGERLDALFRAQAARHPEAVAVRGGERSVRYGDLAGEVEHLAGRLVAEGVRPGDVVAVLLAPSFELVRAALAVLAAEAVWLPLDPSVPEARLATILADAAPRLVLTRSVDARALPEGMPALVLDRPSADEAAVALAARDAAPADAGIAYLVYTSGSTGAPKGVRGTHAGMVNRVRWSHRAFPFAPGETCALKTSPSFVDSIAELLAPLLGGATLAVPEGAERETPAGLLRFLARERVTRVVLVPSLLDALVDEAPDLGGALPALVLWSSSGEALPGALARRFQAAHPTATLINLYGTSEVAADVTCAVVPRPAPDVVPAGRPLDGVRVYVLDARGGLVPFGVEGEVWVGGPQVADGYWRRPDLTAERFVPDPFAGLGGASMYRTGDRALRRPDGTLVLRGRADAQAKVRGVRVELGEVEAQLTAHPDVLASAADVRDGVLVAWFVPRPEVTNVPAPAALRAFLAQTLPGAVVPSKLLALSALPRLPNGKLDRAALVVHAGDEATALDAAPRTEVERTVAGLFAEILGVEHVGRDDDFFQRGGHSLLGMRLVARIGSALGVDLPVGRLFEHPTVAGLAEVLRERRPGASALVATGRRVDVPLAAGQERFWMLDTLGRDVGLSGSYNVGVSIRLRGELDVKALERAATAVVRAHEVLRTTYRWTDEGARQTVQSPSAVTFPVRDVAEGALDQAMLDEVHRPFDLTRDLALRGRLLRLGGGHHVLVLTMHHLAVDGWSLGVVLEQLVRAAGLARAGRPVVLEEPPVRYVDWALAQRARVADGSLDHERAYWRETLAGLPDLFPEGRPLRHGYRAFRHAFSVPRDVADGLRAIARDAKTTLLAVMLAAYDVFLARLTGQRDVVVALSTANRADPALTHAVGLYFNPLAMRTRLSAEDTFVGLVERVKATMFGAFEHQEYPFADVLRETWPAHRGADMPFGQAELALSASRPDEAAAFHRQASEALGVEVTGVPRPFHGLAKSDLRLDVDDTGGGLEVGIRAARVLFDEAVTERMEGALQAMLAAFAHNPETRLGAWLEPVPGMAARSWARVPPPPAATAPAPRPREEGLEDALLAVARRVLAADDLRADEDLFERGATSLTVVALDRALQQALGPTAGPRAIYEARSVRGLAAALATAPASGSRPQVEAPRSS